MGVLLDEFNKEGNVFSFFTGDVWAILVTEAGYVLIKVGFEIFYCLTVLWEAYVSFLSQLLNMLLWKEHSFEMVYILKADVSIIEVFYGLLNVLVFVSMDEIAVHAII